MMAANFQKEGLLIIFCEQTLVGTAIILAECKRDFFGDNSETNIYFNLFVCAFKLHGMSAMTRMPSCIL